MSTPISMSAVKRRASENTAPLWCVCAVALGLLAGCSEPNEPEPRRDADPSASATSTPRTGARGGTGEVGGSMASLEPDAGRGADVYARYCQTCHGSSGRGDGPGASALNPEPRDFVGGFTFDADGDGERGTSDDLRAVVANGAASYGGSKLMVPWGGTLSAQQIVDVVAHVRELAKGGAAE